MKILIIEDEKLLADSIGALLTQRGFSVEIVYDGEAGAQYAELGVLSGGDRRGAGIPGGAEPGGGPHGGGQRPGAELTPRTHNKRPGGGGAGGGAAPGGGGRGGD